MSDGKGGGDGAGGRPQPALRHAEALGGESAWVPTVPAAWGRVTGRGELRGPRVVREPFQRQAQGTEGNGAGPDQPPGVVLGPTSRSRVMTRRIRSTGNVMSDLRCGENSRGGQEIGHQRVTRTGVHRRLLGAVHSRSPVSRWSRTPSTARSASTRACCVTESPQSGSAQRTRSRARRTAAPRSSRWRGRAGVATRGAGVATRGPGAGRGRAGGGMGRG